MSLHLPASMNPISTIAIIIDIFASLCRKSVGLRLQELLQTTKVLKHTVWTRIRVRNTLTQKTRSVQIFTPTNSTSCSSLLQFSPIRHFSSRTWGVAFTFPTPLEHHTDRESSFGQDRILHRIENPAQKILEFYLPNKPDRTASFLGLHTTTKSTLVLVCCDAKRWCPAAVETIWTKQRRVLCCLFDVRWWIHLFGPRITEMNAHSEAVVKQKPNWLMTINTV